VNVAAAVLSSERCETAGTPKTSAVVSRASRRENDGSRFIAAPRIVVAVSDTVGVDRNDIVNCGRQIAQFRSEIRPDCMALPTLATECASPTDDTPILLGRLSITYPYHSRPSSREPC